MARQRLEQILGTSLGDRGEPLIPLLKQLRDLGVSITCRQSLSNIRHGIYTGGRTIERLESSTVLLNKDASAKDAFYWDITATALGLLKIDQSEPDTQEFVTKTAYRRKTPMSEGFTQTLAHNFELHPTVFGRCVRAMRTDFVMAQTDPSYPGYRDLIPEAIETIDGFLKKVSGQKRADLAPGFKAIDKEWDRQKLQEFYQKLYTLPGREIGGWSPVEFDLLEHFYALQSTRYNNIFTPLDRMILAARQTGQSAAGIIEEVAKRTGVSIDKGVIEIHRNLLVLGRVVRSPQGSKKQN